jgi:type I restriction enzyme M protein
MQNKSKKLLSIGEAADLFSVHQDTLRNWEKKGLITPLRVGVRKDRKYRPEDIEKIIDKDMGGLMNDISGGKMTLATLKQFLWKSADILRGKIDSSDYKKYIFGLLFYKRISDVWDEEYNQIMDEYHDETIAKEDYNHRFQVPEDCRWAVITKQADGIGKNLNEIFDKLTNANSPKLDKIFDDLDFANKDRFPNETLQKLINNFSEYNFGNNYISSDLLGDAYEYLIKEFAADAGKKGGEFYSPREVERVIINILKPHEKDHIYDPTVGSGGFLLEAYNYLKQKSGEKVAKSLYFHGQEINIGTFAIAKINMFLHGLDSADIRRGDTLANPQFMNDNGTLQTFDICVGNPPYAIKEWEYEAFKTNKYGRLDGYEMPPKKNADFAFVLHFIKSMNANGRAGVLLPHGVLFKSGLEGRIREKIVKQDLIETIVELPGKLFFGTDISVAIVILNKNKPKDRKNKILFINAKDNFLKGKKQNTLRQQDVDLIVKSHEYYKDVTKYAKLVDIKELEEHGFNLNVTRYVDTTEEEEKIDVIKVKQELAKLEQVKDEINQKMNNYLKELKY